MVVLQGPAMVDEQILSGVSEPGTLVLMELISHIFEHDDSPMCFSNLAGCTHLTSDARIEEMSLFTSMSVHF